MRELTDALNQEAGRAQPRADLDDVLRRAARRRRRRLVMAGAAAVAVGLGLGVGLQMGGHRGDGGGYVAASVADQPAAVDLAAVGGPSIAGAGPDQSYPAGTIERVDDDREPGPWTVVLRQPGSGLGGSGVTITYPVTLPPGMTPDLGRSDDRGGIHRTALYRPLGPDRLALVTGSGSLPDGELSRVADAVGVLDGRLVVADGLLHGAQPYELVAAGLTRPAVVAEARYGCDSLGESEVLGALCYAGLTTSPGFESALYQVGFAVSGDVNGAPAVVSTVGGGNATLSWEIQPGVIAYVGYSGAGLGPDQVEALHRLAARFVLLDPAAWAATEPQAIPQDTSWVQG